MNLLNVHAEETNVNLPKFTEHTFILRNNYYVVFNGEVYNYYPIKVLPWSDESPLIRFEKAPPVLLEGYAMVGRKVYLVTLKDLQRKVIRKSREIQREVQNATESTPSTIDTSNPESVSALLNTSVPANVRIQNEPGLGDDITMEISEAADAAWQDQVRALLNDPDEEEGIWEVEGDS